MSEQLQVKTMAEYMAEGKQPEILFWVGSAGSYDDRAKKITKAFARLLNEAKVDLVISGHHHRFRIMEPNEDQNKFPVLVIGKDMILKADVSPQKLSLSIRDIEGGLVDEFEIPGQ